MNIKAGFEVLKDHQRNAETLLNYGSSSRSAAPARVRFDRYVLDHQRGCLLAGDEEITLRPKTFEFLRYLASHPGRLVSKDELLAAVWPDVVVTEDSLFQCAAELRRALQDQDQHLVKTVQRRGYRFDAAVSIEPCMTVALPNKPSIAVLPFQNLSADPKQEYFADGMVEEVTTALSRVRWLFVIARNSSFTYKGRAVDVKQVGRDLGVRYVLEGSVRKAGSRLRITAQLIDASNGAHLWADRFGGTLEDIFDLQDQVAASVVGAITPRLEQAEIERAAHKPTESLDAYDYFLRGMASVNRGTAFARSDSEAARDDIDEALGLFSRAIELDPDFASAYGMGAHCYTMRRTRGWMTDRAHATAEAARLARRAVGLGKDNADALSRGGLALAFVVRELDEGAAAIERALVLNPNLAAAWLYSAWTNVWLGKPDTAIENAAWAMRLSPLDPLIHWMQSVIAHAHVVAGRYDEGSTWADMVLRENPDYPSTLRAAAVSNALAGRMAKAEKAVARLRQLNPALRVSNLRDVLGPFQRPEDVAIYEEGLRRAGLPE